MLLRSVLLAASVCLVVGFPKRYSYEIKLEILDPNEKATYLHFGKVNLGFVEKSGQKSYYSITDK